MPHRTPAYPEELTCAAAGAGPLGADSLYPLSFGTVDVATHPLLGDGGRIGSLILVHDMSFVERRSEATRRYLFVFFVALSTIVALITVVIAHLSWRGWVHGLRTLLRGEGIIRPTSAAAMPELRPLARDVRALVRQLERQYRPLDDSQLAWTPQALRAILEGELSGHEVIVVSKREPYVHVKTPGGVRVQRPASGLVTALEPVMRACSGTWIAHGSGSADRATVDRHDRIDVPPEAPAYKLRRIWLSPEEEAGYYSGFANEGLWPLEGAAMLTARDVMQP